MTAAAEANENVPDALLASRSRSMGGRMPHAQALDARAY